MTVETQTHWCGLRVIQSRAPLKPTAQFGGSDDYARATLLDLSDLTSTSPRPYNHPRRVDYGLAWWVGLVCLVVPWLVGVGVLAQAALRWLVGG